MGENMKITERAALELASHEGLVRQAYKDVKGIWTWGIGITSASGHRVDRYIGKPQSLEHCLAVYVWALDKYAADVRRAFSGYTLSESQFAAALSFHYNTGAIGSASWVTLWRSGDMQGARSAFMEWKKPASIIGRRQKEFELLFDGKWSHDGKMNEYTRLNSDNSPNMRSVQRVDIRAAMRAAFEPPIQTDIKPERNTLIERIINWLRGRYGSNR